MVQSLLEYPINPVPLEVLFLPMVLEVLEVLVVLLMILAVLP